MAYKMRVVIAVLAAALIGSACSNIDPSDTGTVAFKTSISGRSVTNSAYKEDGVVQSNGIDSIHIDSVRVLIKRIKLYPSEDDTANGGDVVKAGPAVISFNNDTNTVVFKQELPVGLYRKLKLEIHRFSSSEADMYASHPVFGDFAFPYRITIIVNGTLYGPDGTNAFTVTHDQTENIWMYFEPDLEITASTTTTVDWNFDAVMVFTKGGRCLDPRRLDDLDDIKYSMKHAWKVCKHRHDKGMGRGKHKDKDD